MRYSIRFLLIITAVLAVLALCAAFLTQTTYFTSCAIVPATLALTFRYCQNSEHGFATLIAFGSAILIGSFMLAYGSYDQTFNNDATGFLVGDGWNSVRASAIVGAIVGFFCGIIAIMIYFLLSGVIGRLVSHTPNDRAGEQSAAPKLPAVRELKQ